ncbi:unnamed protein product [Cylicocyclus nassatus]|uniref:Uncharacterized protein n=1 Tax=Cylicocyclus nassatus TaxID=53992 RepID=A0AA36MAF3_CYLNA|nr:unnamed protein product [Cylicocyclus nassatus]
MLGVLLRQKKVTEQFLHHSEFSRSLGLPMTIALVCTCSVPLLIFVLMPFSLTSLAGPSTLLAVLITFIVVLLASAHLTELSCALPKNCVLYQFTYVMLGELPAFIVAWTAVLDSVCISTVLCRAWSEHINLLFRRFLHPYMSLKLLHHQSGLWIISDDYDFTALFAVVITFLILCCNLRVVGTVSLCLVVVAILMTASCTMVGFFHADPQNWIDANFFRFGFDGVLKAICALSCAFAGVDATSYLFEETKTPRKQLSTLLPTLVTFLSLFFFFVVMIFSLSTDVSKLPENVLVPEMFSVLNVPAAKYMLTVAAVCGLSGAVLASFLPGSRMINALSSDRLLPLPADMTARPVMSVFIFSILVSFGLLIHRNVLLHLVFFTTPMKMIVAICLVVLQHYTPEPVGIPHETSHYKSIRKKRQQVSLAGDETSIVTSTVTHDDEDSDISVDTSVFLQMAVAKREAQRHQLRLEKKLEKSLSEKEEKEPVLVKSVSHYSSMAPVVSRQQQRHNCITDACSQGDSDDETPQRIHLYAQEVPELPFVETFHGAGRASTPVNIDEHYRKSKWTLVLFLTSSTLFCQFAVFSGFESVTSSVVLSLILAVVFLSIMLGTRITTNDHLQRRQGKVPLFPYVSYLTLFVLIFALATTSPLTLLMFAAWSFIGLVLYFIYGVCNSAQRHRTYGAYVDDDDAEMYRAIIGNDYAIQFE